MTAFSTLPGARPYAGSGRGFRAPARPPGGSPAAWGIGLVIDLDRLRRALVLAALGAVASALLLPPLALLRHTAGHDWYAARRVSVAEALIAVGFDPREPMDYRLADGRAVTWTREGVATWPRARESRALILAVVADNAVLGAGAGFVVLFALSGLLNLARHEPAAPRGRGPSAAGRRPGFIEGIPPYDAHGPGSAERTRPAPAPKPAPKPGGPVKGTAEAARPPVSADAAKGGRADGERPEARPGDRPAGKRKRRRAGRWV